MPYKTWAVGEEMLAQDFNDFIAEQTVPTFADAAQRTAQLPGPQKGQLSTLDTRTGALSIWTGAAWADVTPLIQSGNQVITLNAAGGGGITFPTPFAAAPNSVQLIDLDAGVDETLYFGIIGGQLTASSVGFIVRKQTGAVHASGLVRVGWLAIGARP